MTLVYVMSLLSSPPWSSPPNTDPAAWPDWARAKALATDVYRQANREAAAARARLGELRDTTGATSVTAHHPQRALEGGALRYTAGLLGDDDTADAQASSGGGGFAWEPELFLRARAAYGEAATRSDLTLWLMSKEERRFGTDGLVAGFAGNQLYALRDLALLRGNAFGKLPDDALHRVLGWLLRVQPLRYPNPEMAVALGNMASCSLAVVEMAATSMFERDHHELVDEMTDVVQIYAAGATHCDPLYLKGLHRKYRAIDVVLRHKASCDVAAAGGVDDNNHPDAWSYFLGLADDFSRLFAHYGTGGITLPLVVMLTQSELMEPADLADHLARRRSRLLLPVAERSFSPLPRPACGTTDTVALSCSMVPFRSGSGHGQWLKIRARWCTDAFVVMDHDCLWFEEMDPENGDDLERPPSGFVRSAFAHVHLSHLRPGCPLSRSLCAPRRGGGGDGVAVHSPGFSSCCLPSPTADRCDPLHVPPPPPPKK